MAKSKKKSKKKVVKKKINRATGKKVSKKKKKKSGKKKTYRRGALGSACFKYFDSVGVYPKPGKEDAHFEGCVRAAKAAKPDSTFGRAYYSWMRNHYRNENDLPPKAKAKAKVKKATHPKTTKKTSKKKKKARRKR